MSQTEIRLQCSDCKEWLFPDKFRKDTDRFSPVRQFLDNYCKRCRLKRKEKWRSEQRTNSIINFWKDISQNLKYLPYSEKIPGFADFSQLNNQDVPQVTYIYFSQIEPKDTRNIKYYQQIFQLLYKPKTLLLPAEINNWLEHNRNFIRHFLLEKKCISCQQTKQTHKAAFPLNDFLSSIDYGTKRKKLSWPTEPLNFKKSYKSLDGYSSKCISCLE